MSDHPFTGSAQGQLALRLLLFVGLKRWEGSGGMATGMPLAKWEELLRPLDIVDAAVITLHVVHDLTFLRVADILGGTRQRMDQRFRRGLQEIARSSAGAALRELLESHHDPRKHLYKRKRSHKFKGHSEEQTEKFFAAVRSAQHFDRLFGDSPPRTSDE